MMRRLVAPLHGRRLGRQRQRQPDARRLRHFRRCTSLARGHGLTASGRYPARPAKTGQQPARRAIRFEPPREPARPERFIAGSEMSVVRAATAETLARIV